MTIAISKMVPRATLPRATMLIFELWSPFALHREITFNFHRSWNGLLFFMSGQISDICRFNKRGLCVYMRATRSLKPKRSPGLGNGLIYRDRGDNDNWIFSGKGGVFLWRGPPLWFVRRDKWIHKEEMTIHKTPRPQTWIQTMPHIKP